MIFFGGKDLLKDLIKTSKEFFEVDSYSDLTLFDLLIILISGIVITIILLAPFLNIVLAIILTEKQLEKIRPFKLFRLKSLKEKKWNFLLRF